ncbi:MAG: hypothetical protein WCI27_07120, partial [Candidatus Omnitrophota bacterium]
MGFITGLIIISVALILLNRKFFLSLNVRAFPANKYLLAGVKAVLPIAGCFFFLMFLVNGCFMFGARVSSENIFKKYFGENIPSDVRIIEGGGSTWPDYSLRLVFTGDARVIERLLKKYHLSSGCAKGVPFSGFDSEIRRIGDIPCYYDGFDYPKGDHEEMLLYWDR